MIKEILEKSRSYRRFKEDMKIERETLEELVDLTRFCPSTGNIQPMKYALVWEEDLNSRVFKTLAWAGYLREWDGPTEGERPTAYIVLLKDRNLMKTASLDDGIVAQTICIGAAEKGIGTCMIGSVKREELRSILELDERFDISLVIALGYPNEIVVLEDIKDDGNFKYWRDEVNHYVPKRTIDEVIIK